MNDETTNNPTDQNEPTVFPKTDDAPSSQTSTKTEEQETEKIASRRKSIGCLIKALIVAAIAYLIYRTCMLNITKHITSQGRPFDPIEDPKSILQKIKD